MNQQTILLVEDNPASSLLTKSVLARAGFSVRTATSLAAARLQLKLEIPHCLVLDLGLPDGNGLDLAADLRSDPAMGRLVIVALTSFAMSGDRDRCLAAGCDGYITKPISVSRLADEIEALIRAASPIADEA